MTGFIFRFELSVSTEPNASGRVWLLAGFRTAAMTRISALQLRYGTRIQVTTTLDRTGNYRNPGVSTLSEYLERRDFDATGIVSTRRRSFDSTIRVRLGP